MHPLPPRPTLFPYTTLFRSRRRTLVRIARMRHDGSVEHRDKPLLAWDGDCGFCRHHVERWKRHTGDRVEYATSRERSEEHTSELQSQSNLVCRLLLEKKKKQ